MEQGGVREKFTTPSRQSSAANHTPAPREKSLALSRFTVVGGVAGRRLGIVKRLFAPAGEFGRGRRPAGRMPAVAELRGDAKRQRRSADGRATLSRLAATGDGAAQRDRRRHAASKNRGGRERISVRGIHEQVIPLRRRRRILDRSGRARDSFSFRFARRIFGSGSEPAADGKDSRALGSPSLTCLSP